MKTELHTDLEMSKRLKEAGFPQEGCSAYHVKSVKEDEYILMEFPISSMPGGNLAAPAVQEIAEKLPSHFCTSELGNMEYRAYRHDCGEEYRKYVIGYINMKDRTKDFSAMDESMVKACAKMWLNLRSKGLFCGQSMD